MNRLFETEYGYFSSSGDEYIIKKPKTPSPWINVISNGKYSLTISQVGGGFSWFEDSNLNRITRWYQDLIRDNWGKYIYIRDNDTGEIWNPTWLPIKKDLDLYECHHGFGYTTFYSKLYNIYIELTIFVPLNEKHEVWYIKIENQSRKHRKVSIFSYLEWRLGVGDNHREFHKTFLETEFNPKLKALLAKKRLWELNNLVGNRWNISYPFIGFHATNKEVKSYEGDKEQFLGTNGDLYNPAEIIKGQLSDTSGKWFDSIGSLKVEVSLAPNEDDEAVFLLGIAKQEEDIEKILNTYRDTVKVKKSLNKVKQYWRKLFDTLFVETPDQALNLLVNKWLKYQAISCRIFARAAYYQQAGGYGYRDQLQDSQIFLPINPQFTANQIILHAKNQFQNGEVFHWWDTITKDGWRDHKMTDDLLWLPLVVISYLNETQNYRLLTKRVSYIDKKKPESIFDHCCQSINRALNRMSSRGLPLIGAGDWNDGLNAVGINWKGESIWLAHFLYYVLVNFSIIAKNYDQKEIATQYQEKANMLKESIDQYAWDGEWFYRATKDNGDKIGSKDNKEGKIFLNAQTWSIISESSSPERQEKALKSVKEHLLKEYGPLLLYPAYKEPDSNIGYLTRYAPGIRENAAVYTHAATWAIWAFAKAKDSKTAYDIFRRICPIYNGLKPNQYIGEPYVTPGNIDGPESPTYGKGAWTWYTGSAAWLQKVVIEWILGIRATEEGLHIDPCIPREWKNFTIKRRFRGTDYLIEVKNPKNRSYGVSQIKVEGEVIEGNLLPIVNKIHCYVEVTL